MKGNSNTQPERLKKLGTYWQVRWNIVKNDRTDEDGNSFESWDYDYANCENPYRNGIIEGVIRSKYTQNEIEAILSNAYDRKDMFQYLRFQAWREMAKEVADNLPISQKQRIQLKMPFALAESGGKYETLANRIMKLGCPYEITKENDVEYVTVWLHYIDLKHEYIREDVDLEIQLIEL